MEDVYDLKDLGSGVIHDPECDSPAFRKDDVDLQVWTPPRVNSQDRANM